MCIRDRQYILEIGQALADDHAAVMVGAGFSKNAEKISTAGREFLSLLDVVEDETLDSLIDDNERIKQLLQEVND